MKRKRSLKMNLESYYIPKQNISNPKGEDAHFIHKADYQTIGVADGVGGWTQRGVDEGKYARELMKNCVLALDSENKGVVNPMMVLNEAYFKTKAPGSSTACIITLTRDNYLHVVNVGDSGFMLFRDGEMVYKSPIQQRGFNCPYQLGRSKGSDRPSSAEELKVAVKERDILVVGTDGLFDNMFVSEMKEIIGNVEKEGLTPKELAWTLAELASYNSLDKDGDTPFAQAKRFAGCGQDKGGKVDDITVIVAYIVL
ncbi:probable protein phosphatase 2C 55 [Vitis vinifera]|nr:probable protein phosphatase 2C 55 [Vitis vinifera]